jgi:hypothetical protein
MSPAQAGLDPELMLIVIAGTSVLVTDIVIVFDVAVAGLAHASLDVRIAVISSPSVREVEV